jgi:hypothetical protein
MMFMPVFIKFRQFVQKERERRMGGGCDINVIVPYKTREVS